MKMNFLVSIISALLLGFLCANFIFKEYGAANPTFSESGIVYFLQYGVYTNENNININSSLKHITVERDGKIYVYVGITLDKENALKIQKSYKDKNIDIYIKEDNITNKEFVSELAQYDILLDNSDTLDEMNSVLSTILASYEEFVLKR